eukprot:g639.t1
MTSASQHEMFVWPKHLEAETIAGIVAKAEEVGIEDIRVTVFKEGQLPGGCLSVPTLRTGGRNIFGENAIAHYFSYLRAEKASTKKKKCKVSVEEDESIEADASATFAKKNGDVALWSKATKKMAEIYTEWEQRSNISITDEIACAFEEALKKLGVLGDFPVSVRKASTAVGGANKGNKKGGKGKKGKSATTKEDETASVKHHFQIDASLSFQIFTKSKKGETPVAWKSPIEVARAIVDALPPIEAKCTVAEKAPFINITLPSKMISSRVQNMLKLGIPRPRVSKKLKVAVDYSSPNIAKDMHVGHLRSSIIGDAVCRVLEFCGHDIVRLNHVGDWGTQFGMLIAYLKNKYPDFVENPPNITDLTVLYKESKKVFNEDEDFKKVSHEEVVKLQSGDKTNLKIWKKLCALSEEMFQTVYKRLGIHPDLKVQGESFYNPIIPGCIAELTKKGLATKSEGATLVWVKDGKKKKKKKKSLKPKKKKKQDGEDGEAKKDGRPAGMMVVPLIAVKSDGGFGYDSTDLAAVQYRLEKLKCDWVIYCVDAGQRLHFELIFGAAKMAGWAKEGVHRLDHVMFGVVCGDDGKRIKTRSGKSVRLVDLLDEGVRRCTETLKKRISTEGSTCKLRADQIADVASKLAHGCVKYFDLRLNRVNDYVFSFDQMLSADGDTNVYLQQQHARICSVFRKAKASKGIDSAKALLASGHSVDVTEKEEIALGIQILRLPDIIREVSDTLLPSTLCKWLYTLCKRLSSFYAACQVLNSKEIGSRLLLLEAAAVSMRQAMALIGIEPLSEL